MTSGVYRDGIHRSSAGECRPSLAFVCSTSQHPSLQCRLLSYVRARTTFKASGSMSVAHAFHSALVVVSLARSSWSCRPRRRLALIQPPSDTDETSTTAPFEATHRWMWVEATTAVSDTNTRPASSSHASALFERTSSTFRHPNARFATRGVRSACPRRLLHL